LAFVIKENVNTRLTLTKVDSCAAYYKKEHFVLLTNQTKF